MIGQPRILCPKLHQRIQPCRLRNICRPRHVGSTPTATTGAAPVYQTARPHRAIFFTQQRCFSRSSIQADNSSFINHYEVLKISPSASKADLKKQFYTLSKETHPDRHPNDPTAGERFSQISESYSILADEEKRRRYDRDFNRIHGGSARETAGTYAGSRPASGLSKRRGTFRGPPPSFYTQGGYGTSNNGPANSSSSSSSSSSSNASQQQDAYQAGTFNSQAFQDRANTEYDPRGTFRTQSNEDVKRMQRRAAQFRDMQAEIDALNDSDFWGRFVIVSFVVALGVTVGTVVVNMSNAPRGGLTRSDGSKRGVQSNEWAKS